MVRGEHSRKVQFVHDLHGMDSFQFEILEHVNLTFTESRKERRDILIAIEQTWIDKRQPALNTCPRAGMPFGFKHTEESKEKIANAHRGMKRSPTARANMSAAQYRRYERPEEHVKSAERRKGKKASPEARRHMSESSALRGKPRTPEAKAKISASNMGHPVSAETRAKISAANRAAYARKRQERELAE